MKFCAAALIIISMSLFVASASNRAIDPGPRGGPAGAGGLIPGISFALVTEAQDGLDRFQELETFPGGLGPFYNSGPFGACSECHAHPAIGGGSPAVNPQVSQDFNADGATNAIPPFLSIDGPVREMRLKFSRSVNGKLDASSPDGSVHDLFSVTGRADNPTCTLAQPNFERELADGNAIFRIPISLFGDGLIENIDDATILANASSDSGAKRRYGVHGHPNYSSVSGVANRSGNDATITRFGWKAQNKSLLMFSGEAYNVEVGVTNELFETERPEPGSELPPSCKTNATPEDQSNPGFVGVQVNSDITAFAAFMRLLDQPQPGPSTLSSVNGGKLFVSVGCSLCHTPSMTTGASNIDPMLSSVAANLYSDLLLHDMGDGLADGISQGNAGPREFRTAPLWGVGQRLFFLHDGRASDLLQAIEDHSSSGSEANEVIREFNNLSQMQMQAILNFLRSL